VESLSFFSKLTSLRTLTNRHNSKLQTSAATWSAVALFGKLAYLQELDIRYCTKLNQQLFEQQMRDKNVALLPNILFNTQRLQYKKPIEFWLVTTIAADRKVPFETLKPDKRKVSGVDALRP